MKNKVKKKIAIVGAGFTGLVSAYFYSKKGYNVSIFDTSNTAGGIAKDFEIESEKYFSGCHQLLPSNWLEEINFKNQLKLDKYKVHYANYTEIKKNQKDN